jgi:L-serine/L-threonine ammonia-lyase
LDSRRKGEGLKGQVPVLAMETIGAESLNASLKAGELVTLPAITSIATSLGAKRVCEKSFEFAQDPKAKVISEIMSDAEAAMACVRLVDDERVAVEPACGVSVAAVYGGMLKKVVPGLNEKSKVVVVLCGGCGVTIEMLAGWREKYAPMVESMKDRDVPSTYTMP